MRRPPGLHHKQAFAIGAARAAGCDKNLMKRCCSANGNALSRVAVTYGWWIVPYRPTVTGNSSLETPFHASGVNRLIAAAAVTSSTSP